MFFVKRITRQLSFFIPVILIIAGVIFFYLLLKEKNYNLLLMEYISARKSEGSDTVEEKIRRLRNFTHENVHPIHGEKNRLDTVGIEKLTSGIGWCDQISRVFMQLAQGRGITTRLLFLRNKEGSSPHSVAEALDKGDKWVLVDASYDLEFKNKEGQMATMSDIREDFGIVLKNKRVMSFAAHSPWWRDEENLTMYSREPQYVVTKNGARFKPLSCVPDVLQRPFVLALQEMHLLNKKKDFSDSDEYLYYKARSYHLTGKPQAAEELYLKIVNKKGALALKDKTRFFLALLLRDEKRPKESIEVLTDLIHGYNNPSWLPYAFGLRSQLYEVLGEDEKAKEDFAKVVSAPDAYF